MYVKSNGEIMDKVRASKVEKKIVLIGFAIIGSILIILSSWDFKQKAISIFPFGLIVGVFLLVLVAVFSSQFYAKYEFQENGISVKYPFSSQKMISWNEFQQVCVCYSDYGKYGSAFVVIACVKKGAKKNMYGRWKTTSPFSHRSVITMDYTDELYKEIKEKCPYEVSDLRNTQAYRL